MTVYHCVHFDTCPDADLKFQIISRQHACKEADGGKGSEKNKGKNTPTGFKANAILQSVITSTIYTANVWCIHFHMDKELAHTFS